MLSIGKVSSGSASYYSKDNYYAKDSAERVVPQSDWFGQGAKAAGLSGPVDVAAFAKVMAGQVPGGPLLGRTVEGEHVHQPGQDLTFSAPKSVSILTEVLGDKAAGAAHDAAVRAALGHVERNVLQTRIFDPASKTQLPAGNQKMVAALFRHDVSRALDPQTHTHAVVANMVQGEDGKWRSMHSPSLYQAKMLVGLIYRGELAANLKEAGHAIHADPRHGFFEVAGVPDRLIEAYSTRSGEIETALAECGDTSAEAAAKAALITRASKQGVDRADLTSLWQEKAKSAGIDLGDVKARTAEPNLPLKSLTATDILAHVIASTMERSAAVPKTALQVEALKLAVGEVRPLAMLDAVEKAIETGRLIEGKGPLEGQLTTPEAVQREQATIAAMEAGNGAVDPIATGPQVERQLRGTILSAEQKAAVTHMFASPDRTIGVQGNSGTGKTTLLAPLPEIARQRGLSVIGLAPTHTARHELGETGMDAQTLQRFLTRNAGKTPDLAGHMLILDESSMASTSDVKALIDLANQGKAARLVLLGDAKQIEAVGAGAPFRQLQARGMATALVTETRRQRDPTLKASIEALAAGKLEAAWQGVKGGIVEVNGGDMARTVADTWLGLSGPERAATAIIAQTHAQRSAITAHLREGLKAEGYLGAESTTLDTLKSAAMTGAEKAQAFSYRPGQTVVFRNGDRGQGFARGARWQVEGIDRAAGTVTLSDGQTTRTWSPGDTKPSCLEVFDRRQIEIAERDLVRFTRTDPAAGLINGDRARVDAITDRHVALTSEDGDALKIARGDPALAHIDHGWTSTLHAVQGQSHDRIIAAMDAGHAHLTHQKAFYVAVSRARDGVTVITDDGALLKDTLERQTGEKIDALDIAPGGDRSVDEPAPCVEDKEREATAGNAPVQETDRVETAHEDRELTRSNDEIELEIEPELDYEIGL